jgi:hypothetical protein
MEISTADLTGAALDGAVATCDNRITRYNIGGGIEVRGRTDEGAELPETWDLWVPWHPSTDWAQGGPIIDREKLDAFWNPEVEWWSVAGWDKRGQREVVMRDPSYLIAAMRCYVGTKLGPTVEVPDSLI